MGRRAEARAPRPGVLKSYWHGTHRAIEPSETLTRFGVYAEALGITRLANVTGLDYLGVPVFMAIRPNARSLSVAQGKGLDMASARASAFMEAAEFAHAEQAGLRPRIASYADLRAKARVANPNLLPQRKGLSFHSEREMAWTKGSDLRNGEPVWVPYDLVHLDFTSPPRRAASAFLTTSNGLASGNHTLEALCAGLCELIERDASALWRLRSARERAGRRVILSTVADGDCCALLDRLDACAMSVAVWDTTSDIGVASFLCRLREVPGNARSHLGAFWGAGCHLSRAIAMSRAVTEAVQSRLTYIAGSRDDLRAHEYRESEEQALMEMALDLDEERCTGRTLSDVPDYCAANFEDDCERLASLLGRVGLAEIIVVDLTQESFGIPVLRAIVPGLEGPPDHGLCKAGVQGARVRAGIGMRPVVFTGPTLWRDAVLAEQDIAWLPPAGEGDVYRVARERPPAIGLIDGRFETGPAVWHKEILWALAQGIPVYGSASMGALRAAELARFGMRGVGQIYEQLQSGLLEDDDEVALLHAPEDLGFRPLSEAMVDIRATLDSAGAAGVLSRQSAKALTALAKSLFFKDRTWPAILMDLRQRSPREAAHLARWLPTNKVERKRLDAREMIARLRTDLKEPPRPGPEFIFQNTAHWTRLVERSS